MSLRNQFNLFILGGCCSVVMKSLRIYLIGDSVDRNMVTDWCQRYGDGPGCSGPVCNFWAFNSSIHSRGPYGESTVDASCTVENDTISSIMIYGGKPDGPYLHFHKDYTDHYIGTKARIKYALELYYERMGVPDVIIYHSAHWDLQYLYEENDTRGNSNHGGLSIYHSDQWNASLAEYENNLNNRLDEVIHTVGSLNSAYNRHTNGPIIMLRTAVWNDAGGPFLHAMNAVIRHTARHRQLSLYDMDRDVWGSVDWEYSLEVLVLLDWIHPLPLYSISAVEKLMGRRYTSALVLRVPIDLGYSSPIWLGAGPRPNSSMLVSLIREQEVNVHDQHHRHSVFLLDNRLDGTVSRCGPLSLGMQLLMRLGPSDVLTVPSSKFKSIPPDSALCHNIPAILTNQTAPLVFKSDENSLFLVHRGERRLVYRELLLRQLGLNESVVITGISNFWLYLMTAEGPPIPDIYHDNILLYFPTLKYHKVFLVQQGTRRQVVNMESLSQFGLSDKDIINVFRESDLLLIPEGAPLE